jgi:hypothetical protein
MTDQAPDTASTKPVETIEQPVADNPNPELTVDAAAPVTDDAGDEGEPAPRKTAAEDRAERLAARAKANRAERDEGIPHTGDFANDERQTYGDYAPPPAAPAQTQAPETGPSDSAPRKWKLKVNREDKDYTEDEVIALAQKAAAGDRYFEDGRRFYDEARRAAEESRRSRGAPNPEQQRTQQQRTEPNPKDQPNPDDPLAAAFEKLQYGADPKEVSAEFRKALSPELQQTSRAASAEELDRQRMRDDLNKTVASYTKIKEANKELFEQPHAERVMEGIMLDVLKDDLRKINVPEDRIPVNPRELQDWHRHYRTKGYRVRDPDAVFGDVIGKYRNYRGLPDTSTGQQQQQRPPAARTSVPNVNARQPAVALNRDDRRASIPAQPARSAAPPSAPQPSVAPEKSRLEAIARMRDARKGRVFRRAG